MSRHWSLETTYHEEVRVPIGDLAIEVFVESEVPMDGDQRLPMRGNRWWPALVNVYVDIGEDEKLSLHAETARALAMALLHAAAVVDAIDLPCVDPCGHWAPCDCGHT